MHARKIPPLVLITAAIMSCQLAGAGDGSGSGGGVSISGFAFSPRIVTATSGATLTWTNHDGTPHTVTQTSGPAAFDSGDIASGTSYSLVLALPGTYLYKCSRHPTMTGKIIVQ